MNLNDVIGNDKKQRPNKSADDEKNQFIQISSESIEVIADSIGYSDIGKPISTSLAEDLSYRLRELLQGCLQILRHSKKPKLTKDDVNLALLWSDVPQLHGQHSQLVDFLYIPEVDIFSQVDQSVDFTQGYSNDMDVEVYSCLKLNIQHVSFEPDEKIKFDIFTQYFEKMSQSLLSTSDCLLEVALANLQENAKLQPLLPAIAKFLQNLLGFSHENIYIIQRIPLVIHALMKNPHLFLMPEQEIFVELLKNLLLVYNESELDQNIYNLISGIGHMLAKMCSDCDASHVVINDLNGIITDPSRSLITQCRAIFALKYFSIKALDAVTLDTWNLLISKLESLTYNKTETIFIQHILVGAIVDVLRYKLTCMNRHQAAADVNLRPSFEHLLKEGSELYNLANEFMGSAVICIGSFPPECISLLQEKRVSNRARDSCSEIYWTMKAARKLSSTKKWDFKPKFQPANFHVLSPNTSVHEVFDCSDRKVSKTQIYFRVRNWNSRPVEELRKKTIGLHKLPSNTRLITCNYVKNSAKNCLPKTPISLHFPDLDCIL